MLTVLHAIAGIWQQTGGPAESVPRLCSALKQLGNKISILTLEGPLSIAALECKADGVDITTMPHYKLMSLEVFKTSKILAQQVDIVHDHGLWLPLNWAAGRAALKTGKPLIITTRGALNPNALKHSSLKKRIVGMMFDDRYLRAARCIHVTSHDEYLAVRRYGLKNPVAIIPNGIMPDVFLEPLSNQDFRERHGIPLNSKLLLFLSRISWEKGVDDLAVAWRSIASDYPNWHLVIVGLGKPDYVEKLKQNFSSNPGADRVYWLGPLGGREKFSAYSAASLFVLPSHTENFSLVIAEALAAGVPVVTTRGTPWSELPRQGCGWWMPVGAQGITEGLREAMALPDERLKKMGLNGKLLIGEKYAWPAIARQMSDVYEWILARREMPSCVILD
jgi:glycosyltransferase involved in cell wall biosynthesis